METKELKAAIKKAKAKWTPTRQSKNQRASVRPSLGLIPEKKTPVTKSPETKAVRGGLPSKVDLSPLATPIRNQGSAGTCVAFATVGALELAVNIKVGRKVPMLSLSPQQLFSCGGGKVATGWMISRAMTYIKKWGVCDEAAMPYVGMDLACKVPPAGNLAKNWKDRIISVTDAHAVKDSDWKLWLAAGYPITFAMAVYEDFFRYGSGIYRHVAGGLSGYHAVVCVGYGPGYWLVRNSWGDSFGEKGYFRVADQDVCLQRGSGFVIKL